MYRYISTNSFSTLSKVLKRFFIITLFICIGIIFYFATTQAITNVRTSLENQYKEDGKNLSRSYSITIQNMISQAYLTLDILASIDEIKTGTNDEIKIWFKKHRSIRPFNFLNMYYADPEGNVIYDSGENGNIKGKKYFESVSTGKKIYELSSGFESDKTGKLVFTVLRSIFTEDGRIKGFVGGTIELSQLQKLLSEAQVSNAMSPFILDEDGKFLSHINSEMLLKTNHSDNPADYNEIQDYQPSKFIKKTIINMSDYYSENIIKTGISEFKTISTKGNPVQIFIDKVEGTQWTCGIVIPDKIIYGTYEGLELGKRYVIAIIIITCCAFYFISIIVISLLKKQYESTINTDPVTNLLTRPIFENEAYKMIESNSNGSFLLVETDFVGFKFINKNYGEKIGNQILKNYADTLKDLCGIYGGIAARGYSDHFYYFNKVANYSKAIHGLRIALLKVNEMIGNQKYPFNPKFGLSFMIPESEGNIISGKKTIQQMLNEASIAKNTIKQNLDTNYAIYNSQMALKVQQEQKIEHSMKKALEKGEFFVVYQPKINLSTDKIMGAEALVRWNSPELGLLAPDKFIPLFESNGFIKELDFAVYEMVFKFIQSQINNGNPIVPISINMSRTHMNTKEFTERFMNIFNNYNIPTNLIEIEIIERSVSNEKPLLKEITDELHKNGFTVAMDDFGSGESSLNMLASVPIDVLKFDQNFLKNNTDSERSRIFISSLVKMAQQLNKKIVFEGVETEKQRDFLRSINCDSVQGFFYSKPLTEYEFIHFIKEHI